MLTWLEADLASTAQDWIIAYWHHPPYSKGSHDSDDVADSGGRMTDMRANVVPILDDAHDDDNETFVLALSAPVNAGIHDVQFDGAQLSSGTYIATITMTGVESGMTFTKTIKMALSK